MNDNHLKLPFILCTMAASLFCLPETQAYPEFQAFAEKNSGRTADCSMCHVNGNGPVGQGTGQTGGLTTSEIQRLNDARAALEPGIDVDSPILNHFGNLIVKTLGRKKVIELRQDPGQLATALGGKSDLDEDGISDSQEFLDATDPLNSSHGDPGKLLLINFDRYKVQILLAVISILLLNFGFIELLLGFAAVRKARKNKAILDQSRALENTEDHSK